MVEEFCTSKKFNIFSNVRIERNTDLLMIFCRDIAARNCLIDTSTLRTRLADSALARDLFPQDYHCLGDNENRPISWMSLETLQHGQYSTATDVVSLFYNPANSI